MALFPTRTPTVSPDVDPEPTLDVMGLRKLVDHPDVQPLMANKAALQSRMQALTDKRAGHQRAMRDLEQAEVTRMAAQGDSYDASGPSPYYAAKAELVELAEQERLLTSALTKIDEEVESALHQVREAVALELARLRKPHVNALVELMREQVPHNEALRGIEAVSQLLLQYGSWHLVDGSLPQRLHGVERTKASLDRAGVIEAA